MKSFKLSRRTVLRALGASGIAIALPPLEAMIAKKGLFHGSVEGQTVEPPMRVVTFFIPNGVYRPAWDVTGEGRGYDISAAASLAPLADPQFAVRDYVNIISNLRNTAEGASAIGMGHARGTAIFAVGMPIVSGGAGGPSIEQRVAQAKNETGKAIALANEQPTSDPDGATTAHTSNISWSGAGRVFPSLRSPQAAFRQLFGGVPVDDGAREEIAERRRGVLHFVNQQIGGLRSRLGAEDRMRLDEHLTAIEELEKRIDELPSTVCEVPADPGTPDLEAPERADLMLELLARGLHCDRVRYASFMLANGISYQQLPWLEADGISLSRQHHSYAHTESESESNDPDIPIAHAQHARTEIVRYEVSKYAYLLKLMKDSIEGDSNVLENSLVYLGSEHQSGNHGDRNMPVLLAGRAKGQVVTGRHIVAPENTPINDLHLAIVNYAGVDDDTFGFDSDGPLTGLSSE